MVLPGNNATHDDTARKDPNLERETSESTGHALPFFPDRQLTARELRNLLTTGTHEERVSLISDLLQFAPWEEIWSYVTRETVREVFTELELGEGLRTAWEEILDRDD